MKALATFFALCLSLYLVTGKNLLRPRRQTLCTRPFGNPSYPAGCTDAFEELNVPSLVFNSTTATVPSNIDALLYRFCRAECLEPYLTYLQCSLQEEIEEQLENVNLNITTNRSNIIANRNITVEREGNFHEVLGDLLCGQVKDQFCIGILLDDYNSMTVFDLNVIVSDCDSSTYSCNADCLQEISSLLDHFGCCSELIDPLIQANVISPMQRRVMDMPNVGSLAKTCNLSIPASCPPRPQQQSLCTSPFDDLSYPAGCTDALEDLDVPSLGFNSTSAIVPDNIDALLDRFCKVQCLDPYLTYLECRQKEVVEQANTNLNMTVDREVEFNEVLGGLLCGQVRDQYCIDLFLDDNNMMAIDLNGTVSYCNISTNSCNADCLREVNALFDYYGCCSELIDPLIKANVSGLRQTTAKVGGLERILIDGPVRTLAKTCNLFIPVSCPRRETMKNPMATIPTSGSSTITTTASITAFVAVLVVKILGLL